LDWQEIGGVRDSTPGKTDKIPAQDYFNLNTSWQIKSWLTLNAGVRNLLDKDPPFVPTSTTFNTFPDTYDLEGRTFAISLTARH
jgi:outer membrane receptor protein involved in Fe transport